MVGKIFFRLATYPLLAATLEVARSPRKAKSQSCVRWACTAGFFKRLGEVASEESGGFARKFIHERYISLAQTRHYVRKGYPRKPMWVSVKQKAALFGKAHKENDDGDDAGS